MGISVSAREKNLICEQPNKVVGIVRSKKGLFEKFNGPNVRSVMEPGHIDSYLITIFR
jgi:hypothetical protein